MTNRLMETACARLCLLTPIAWDESMPPLFSRMAVRRMMECGALSGLVLRRTDMLPQATFERAEMLLTRKAGNGRRRCARSVVGNRSSSL